MRIGFGQIGFLRMAATVLCCVLAFAAQSKPIALRSADQQQGPIDGTLVLMRHAEKPADGVGLAPEGSQRAKAIAVWLSGALAPMGIHGIDEIAASSDTKHSQRPRLTAEPLAQSLGLRIDQPFADAQTDQMADWLRARPSGSVNVVVWHHGELPRLLAALGADPARIFGDDRWPETIYDKAIVLRYDSTGRLLDMQTLTEPRGD